MKRTTTAVGNPSAAAPDRKPRRVTPTAPRDGVGKRTQTRRDQEVEERTSYRPPPSENVVQRGAGAAEAGQGAGARPGAGNEATDWDIFQHKVLPSGVLVFPSVVPSAGTVGDEVITARAPLENLCNG